MLTMKTDVQAQIDYVENVEIPDFAWKLPADCWYKSSFSRENGYWRFKFECNYANGHFNASALGNNPREAFALTKHLLLVQISEWHRARFLEEASGEPAHVRLRPAMPRILIADDDIDLALALEMAFRQLGYGTEVATKFENLHRRIADSDADYIFLDWKLSDDMTAGQVVEKAVRLIDTFSDLREKFSTHRPRVVTYSVLDRDQVALPAAGDRYFSHFDHWQKPLPFLEVVERVSGLMAAN